MANSATFLDPGTDHTFDFSSFQGTGVGGTSTISSDPNISYTGKRSIKCVTDGANDAFAYTPDGTLADAGFAVSLRARFSSNTPAGSGYFMAGAQAALANVIWYVQLNTNGTLTLQPVGATAANGSTVVSGQTFNRYVVAGVITSTTVFTIILFINGIAEVTANAGTLSNVTSSDLLILSKSQLGAGFQVNFDDVYCDNRTDKTDPAAAFPSLGISVTAKLPFNTGAINVAGNGGPFDTKIGSGGSGYGFGRAPQINERPLNTANGWENTSGLETEVYNIEQPWVGDVDVSSWVPVAVQGWVSITSAGASATMVLDAPNFTIGVTGGGTFYRVANSLTPTRYPQNQGYDIGLQVNVSTNSWTLNECGILFAGIPIPNNQSMQPKKVFGSTRPAMFKPGLAR